VTSPTPSLYAAPVLAHVVRSGFVESVHHGSVVAVDAAGTVLLSVGDVTGPTFPRSSNKPLQALAMVRAGLDLDGELLALASASHSGEPFHLDGVLRILDAAGLKEDDLQNTPNLPYDEAERRSWIADGRSASSLAQNCSGKHAAMLAACVAAGWPTEGYLERDHPLQQAIKARLGEAAGTPVTAVVVDGCGAPQHALPLTGLARGVSSLVEAAPESHERSVADAMRAHPWFVAGTGRDDTGLMRAVDGLLVKVGADGVHVAALPGRGAVALKLDDGAERGRTPALCAGLLRLGVPAEQLAPWALTPVSGGEGVVGEVRSAAALRG
jgi:L-asparaginase II